MKPDLDAIRAHYAGETAAPPRAIRDVHALLAYIDELEAERDGWAPFNDAVKNRALHTLMFGLPPVNHEHEAIVDGLLAKAREGVTKRPIGTYSPGETEWSNRIAHAEARFVEEYDARKAAERQVEELKARIVTLEAMKP